jgi:hypothetical protein
MSSQTNKDDRILPQLDRDDFAAIFSADVEATDVRYTKPSIYKYYCFDDADTQRAFFTKPTIKFAHKDDLNDPFELSRRWQSFGCPLTKEVFEKHVRKRFENGLNDIGYITKKFREQALKRGAPMSRQQVRRLLFSREGRAALEKEKQEGLARISLIGTLLPQAFQEHEVEFIDSFARETGILPLTEDAHSPDMWREYAGDGRGFVLEFNAQHEFFKYDASRNSSTLLRQVFYRNTRTDDFWHNPNYLFLVKETKYAFEK